MSRRLLYVEDHRDTRRLVTRVLEKEGYVVEAYESVEEAEGHIAAGADLQVALLDVRLPGRRGDEFGADLVARFPGLFVLFITAEYDLGPLKERVPSAMLLRKPVELHVVLSVIGCLF